MITQDLFYQLYKEEKAYKINELLQKTVSYLEHRKTIRDNLIKYKDIIDERSNKTYENLITTTDSNVLSNIKFRGINKKTEDIILMYLEYHISANKVIVKTENNIDKIRDKTHSYTLYRRILSDFNKKIIKRIIEERYVLKVGHYLGEFKMIKHTTKKPMVNWELSNINKARIIEEGKVLFKKEDKDEAEKQGLEYEGVEWLEFHSATQLWLDWNYHIANTTFMPILKDYTFKIARGNYSASKMVSEFKKIVTDEQIQQYPNKLKYNGKD